MREIPKGIIEVVSFIRRAWSAFGKLGIIIAIGLAFLFGLTGTVYLSLRSPEAQVPNILGKDRQAAEDELSRAGLNMRVRATRYSADVKPDTILLQLPHPGEVVKTGQTVAVDVSRAQAKEGESSTSVAKPGEEKKPETEEKGEDENKNEAQASNNTNNQNTNNTNNRNKNKNKNANNSNNSNNSNNRNANNANNRNNTNANRPTLNTNNRNTANTGAGNSNRAGNTTNSNRRPPLTTPPFNPGSNTRP